MDEKSRVGDLDKENVIPNHGFISKTMPRASSKTTSSFDRETDNVSTPCFLLHSQMKKSASEPQPASTAALRDITNFKNNTKLDQTMRATTQAREPATNKDEQALLVKLVKEVARPTSGNKGQTKDKLLGKRSAQIASQEMEKRQMSKTAKWSYTDNNRGCLELMAELGLSIDGNITSGFKAPLSLFRYLEKNSKKFSRGLSPEVLEKFANYQSIDTLDMAPSYAGRLNELGMVDAPKFSARKCTLPLYGGFPNLRVVDLANVEVGDEEMRYLIKLTNLEALGLSGTKITDKGLKYLGHYAKFRGTLECMKLCYTTYITDIGIGYLQSFIGLQELDLLGTNCTIKGCLKLVPSFPSKQNTLVKIRVPDRTCSQLEDLHIAYERMNQRWGQLIELEPERVKEMDLEAVQTQLKFHRPYYPDVFLNLDLECMRERLYYLLVRRRKEEYLWSIL